MGENIGFEQDGRGAEFLRPMIIIRKFNRDIFWGIPLTHTLKDSPFYFNFHVNHESGTALLKSSAILSQIRLTDAIRLSDRIGYISLDDFSELMKRFKALLP
ncbi:MAG: hypothetical protein JWN90_372 [Parcubacteria group bacterium]|nr:hypothetical protein [Parcubacteria group bacterium]